MKKKLIAILSIILIAAMLFGCAPKAQPTPTAEVTEPPATVAPKKVVLIGAQRFGDKGPMDSMAAGLDQCATDFGFEVKKIESDSAAAYEEDIRGMANEGYDLIITTFPPMTDPTKTIAAEFPNTKFAAITSSSMLKAPQFLTFGTLNSMVSKPFIFWEPLLQS